MSNSDDAHPHWNTATTTPYAAPIDNMFMTTALSGTSSDRNTIISNRNDSVSTAAKNSGMRRARYELKSMLAATDPDTLTVRSLPTRASGITDVRRRSTRSAVSESCGPVVGTTWTIAAADAAGSTGSLGSGPEARAIPSVADRTSTRPARRPRSSGPDSSAVRMSGPFAPAPNPSVVSS